jgi:hypothetical protein
MNTATQARFSKATMLDDLQRRMDKLAERYTFDPNVGWAQVRNDGIETVVEYGRFSMLQDLIDELSS